MIDNTVLIGVGGGGCKILAKVNSTVEKVFINTDKEDVEKYAGLCIGQKICSGLSAGGDVNYGELAVLESKLQILEQLNKSSNWIIIAPMGGGTSCGATKKLVEIGMENNKSVKVMTSMPFDWEGNSRKLRSVKTIDYIKNLCEIIGIKIDWEKITRRLTLKESFNLLDELYINKLSEILSE